MAFNEKEFNLVINAALKGRKDLDTVVKNLKEIEKALDDQSAAAKRGEAAFDKLKDSEKALGAALESIGSLAAQIGRLDSVGAEIKRINEQIDANRASWSQLTKQIEASGKATKEQNTQLKALDRQYENAQKRLDRQSTSYTDIVGKLEKLGVSTSDLVATEQTLVSVRDRIIEQLNRARAAQASYTDDMTRARAAQDAILKQQRDEEASITRLRAFKQAMTDQRLAEIGANEKAAAAQAAVVATFRKTADEAIASARGYKTLGTAAKSLTASSGGLRSVIQGIVEPSAQARTTLAGVEGQIREVATAASAVKAPIQNYREQVNQLIAAQKALSSQASLVDQFSRQVALLRQARSEFSDARSKVLQYAEALRSSGGANDQLRQSLTTAQAALAAAQKNLVAQLSTTRQMRQSMREAGLATNDLAGTQGRLTSAAQQSVQALNTLAAAHRRHGEAAAGSNKAFDLFRDGGRTTLSLMQRIRGEILAMAAAYVGLYGAIDGARKSIDAYNTKQGIQNQLALSAGNDQAAIAAEYEYIRQQADRLGVSFESAARGYSKFSASAKLAGQDAKSIKYIFESFMEVGRVANLSSDEMDGVFKALEQIISKGTIQAEELRGQLGDRLFGAFQVAAQALKDQFPQLDKAMKNGQVTSDQLLKIAEKYRETVGPRLAEATQNLAANQARLNSALFDFKVLVAEQGFADEYGKLVKTLTEFFGSDDGKKFAKDLSDGLSLVVGGLRTLVENLETVKSVIVVIGTLWASKVAIGWGLSIKTLVTNLGGLQGILKGVASEGSLLMRAFVGLNSFIIGWQIGKLLREKFVEVRLAGVALVVGLDTLWTRMKYSAQIIWAELPNIILDALSAVGNASTSMIRQILGAFSAAARGVGKNDLADSIDKAIRSIEFRTNRIGSASGNLARQMEADLAEIRRIGNEMADEAINPGSTSKTGATAKPTEKPAASGSPLKLDEKEAEARLRLKERLENELATIEARIERQEKNNLASRLAAIDTQYTKMVKDIAKLGGQEAVDLQLKLQAAIEALKLQETRRFNDALLQEQEGLQRKLEQVDSAAARGEKTDLEQRLAAVKLTYEQTYRDIADFRDRLLADNRDTSPADLMKQRLDLGVTALQNIEQQKYYEDAINAVLEERKAKLDVIAVQEKTGLMTATQAREEAARVVSETQPKIEELTAAGLEYVEAMIRAAEATGTSTAALDTLKAKLLEARESAKGLRTEFLSAQQVNEMLADGAVSAFQSVSQTIGEAVLGLKTFGDVINSVRNAFLKFAADFLMQIAQMILKQALLNALKAAFGNESGGVGGIIASAVNALVKHEGGVVGRGGPSRSVPLSMFTNAPRYHGGGIAGLAPDEYPAILKKNEEVLTQNDPRNVLNGGTQAQAGGNVKIINMIDSGSVISEGLSSQEGERALFNFIRANRTGLKAALA